MIASIFNYKMQMMIINNYFIKINNKNRKFNSCKVLTKHLNKKILKLKIQIQN